LKHKGYIICSLIAALLCVASIVFLAKEISGAGQRVHTVGAVRLANFSFKIGRNFDELAASLTQYRDCRYPEREPNTSNSTYIEKFDITWSAFKSAYRNIYRYLPRTGSKVDELRAVNAAVMRDSGLGFLDKYQTDMSPEVSISCSRIGEMLSDIYTQKSQISEFAQGYFELDSKAADEQQSTIRGIYKIILFLSASFLVATFLTIALIAKTLREATESSQKSQIAREQAMVALTELRQSVDKSAAQKNFFAAASHDLRQPLHALGLYVGSLEKHVHSDQAKHILNCANLSTESLSTLLDSLLDISKLDAGIIELNYEEFAVEDLLSRLHSRFLPDAVEKGLELRCTTDDSRVHSDEQLLDRMLQNLLSNSISYTEKGIVEIACRTVAAEVTISVSDTGRGIPKQKQEAVFNEFFQLDAVSTDRGKGLGLGLSIVKRFSELLDLSLDMKSSDGEGTTFTIRLPAITQHDQIEPQTSDGSKTADLPPGLKVMLVDDDESVLDSTAIALQSRNCMVRVAEDGEGALRLCAAEAFVPDIIISDYRLRREKNGVQAIEGLRASLGKKIPAILLTGDTAVNFAADTGTGFEVVYKPVDVRGLVSRIAKLVPVLSQSKKQR